MGEMVEVSRRGFLKTIAMGAAVAALPLRGLAAADTLRVGIGTYSYHNISLDDMVAQLNLLKITEIEMSRGEFMLMNHPTEEMCRGAREKFDRGGIKCVSY